MERGDSERSKASGSRKGGEHVRRGRVRGGVYAENVGVRLLCSRSEEKLLKVL